MDSVSFLNSLLLFLCVIFSFCGLRRAETQFGCRDFICTIWLRGNVFVEKSCKFWREAKCKFLSLFMDDTLCKEKDKWKRYTFVICKLFSKLSGWNEWKYLVNTQKGKRRRKKNQSIASREEAWEGINGKGWEEVVESEVGNRSGRSDS